MIHKGNGALAAHYDDKEGWTLDVDAAIPVSALMSARDYIYKVNYDRWLLMKHGDQKDRVGRALKDLKAGKIRQKVAGKKYTESVLFQSTEKESKTIYSLPGVNHG